MTKNLYIASIEPGCGKSVIALGLMDLLARQYKRLAFYRPVVSDRSGRDDHVELIRSRFCADRPYESLYGVSHETAAQRSDAGQIDLLLAQIDRRFHELDESSDAVLCEGVDHTELAAPFDFEFDALLARRLNCRVVLLSSARRRSAEEAVQVACAAQDAFARQGCQIAASIVSRVRSEDAATVRSKLTECASSQRPVFLLPEVEHLSRSTAGQIAAAVEAVPLFDDQPTETGIVRNCRVAAMQLSHFLQYIDEGCLVITPGDRSDLILAALASRHSAAYPNIAGIILTGGLTPPVDVMRLLEGCHPHSVPIYVSPDDTYTTAMKVQATRPAMHAGGDVKANAALQAFADSIDVAELSQAIGL